MGSATACWRLSADFESARCADPDEESARTDLLPLRPVLDHDVLLADPFPDRNHLRPQSIEEFRGQSGSEREDACDRWDISRNILVGRNNCLRTIRLVEF